MHPTIRLIGVPMDFGQSLRGVDVGPSAIRYAGLTERLEKLHYRVMDCGNIAVPVRSSLPTDPSTNFADPIRCVCEELYTAVAEAITAGDVPLVMGGDHSIAIGSVGGATHDGPVGLLWIDAHADCNTPETSPSGNIHGMPLATLTGRGIPKLVNVGRKGAKIPPENVALIALRAADREERVTLRNSRMGIYTMREIDERGIAATARNALHQLRHVKHLHVSLDMDSLDPNYAPGVGTPVAGGLSTREAHLLMEIIAEDGRLRSLDVVEINPILDSRNRTATLAADLLASLLGQTIL